jgi:hypothetical protein
MFYKTEPKRNTCHEIFCITDSDAQRSAQRRCSSLSESFLLSLWSLVMAVCHSAGRASGADSYICILPSSESHVNKIITLNPSGHYMYRQFNIQQFYVPPTQCIYVFCVDLRTNSDYIQHKLTDLYNWDGVCLLRGTGWLFKNLSLKEIISCNEGFIYIYIYIYMDGVF